MSKKKTHSELEHVRGLVRKLEQENRQLRRRLKESEKYNAPQDEEYECDSEDTHPKIIHKFDVCNECGKGKLKTFEIIGRIYEECDVCEYRKKISD